MNFYSFSIKDFYENFIYNLEYATSCITFRNHIYNNTILNSNKKSKYLNLCIFFQSNDKILTFMIWNDISFKFLYNLKFLDWFINIHVKRILGKIKPLFNWKQSVKIKCWRGKLNQWLIGVFWTLIFSCNKVVCMSSCNLVSKQKNIRFDYICNLIPLNSLKLLRHHFLLSHMSRLSIILYLRRFALSNI